VEKLADQKLVLIFAKAFQNQSSELRLGHGKDLLLNSQKPARGGPGEMHRGHLDPTTWSNIIRLEIIVAIADPYIRIFAIKFGEIHFG
jgi:hypothetical protein